MNARNDSQETPIENPTTTERKSDRELVVKRSFNAPARLVFEAWSKPELFQRWWVPKSCGLTLVSYEADVRKGGGYRLEFSHPAAPEPFAVFGKYLEMTPHSRIVWTNDEGEGEVITTLTFEETNGKTLLAVHDLYPSKAALDEAISTGATSGMPESLAQLDELLGMSSAA